MKIFDLVRTPKDNFYIFHSYSLFMKKIFSLLVSLFLITSLVLAAGGGGGGGSSSSSGSTSNETMYDGFDDAAKELDEVE